MKKDITYKMQIIQTSFVLSILIIALLEKNNILKNNLWAFYFISIFVFGILINIISIIKMKKYYKEDGEKYYEKEKAFIINLFCISIELLFLYILCYAIDYRADKIEFSKHCKETEAFVYDVTEDVSYITRNANKEENYQCIIEYTYYFRYYIGNILYEAQFVETGESFYERTKTIAKRKAESTKLKLNKNDTFTLYYNTNNPNDWRLSIAYVSDIRIKVLEFIAIGFQLFCLGKTIKEYNKDKKLL